LLWNEIWSDARLGQNLIFFDAQDIKKKIRLVV